MDGTRHATDRVDWTVIVECSENPDHFELDGSALNIEPSADAAITIEECPVCGADVARVQEQSPTETLT